MSARETAIQSDAGIAAGPRFLRNKPNSRRPRGGAGDAHNRLHAFLQNEAKPAEGPDASVRPRGKNDLESRKGDLESLAEPPRKGDYPFESGAWAETARLPPQNDSAT